MRNNVPTGELLGTQHPGASSVLKKKRLIGFSNAEEQMKPQGQETRTQPTKQEVEGKQRATEAARLASEGNIEQGFQLIAREKSSGTEPLGSQLQSSQRSMDTQERPIPVSQETPRELQPVPLKKRTSSLLENFQPLDSHNSEENMQEPVSTRGRARATRKRFGIIARAWSLTNRDAYKLALADTAKTKRAEKGAPLTRGEIKALRGQAVTNARELAHQQQENINIAAKEAGEQYLNEQAAEYGTLPSRIEVRQVREDERKRLQEQAKEDQKKRVTEMGSRQKPTEKDNHPDNKGLASEKTQKEIQEAKEAEERIKLELRRQELVNTTGAENNLFKAAWDKAWDTFTANGTRPLNRFLLEQINADAVRNTDKVIRDVRRDMDQTARNTDTYRQELVTRMNNANLPNDEEIQAIETAALREAKTTLPLQQQEEELLLQEAKKLTSHKTQPLSEVQKVPNEKQILPSQEQIAKMLDTPEGHRLAEEWNEKVDKAPQAQKQHISALGTAALMAFILGKSATEQVTE